MRLRKTSAQSSRRSWSRSRWLITGLAATLVVAAGAGWWLLGRDDVEAARSITAAATVGEVTRTVSATGTLEPAESETLSFEVTGTVTAVLVDLGDTVKKGQAVARVDPTLLESQLDAAESTVTAAEDDLDDAEDSGSSVQLAAAQSQLATARDELTSAQGAVSGAVLRAPFAGQVVSIDLEPGDVVGSGGASTGSQTGAPTSSTTSATSATSADTGAIEVASVNRFVVETTVSSTDLKSIRKGLQAQVTATDVDDTLYGTVTSVGRVATTTSSGGAAFPVTVALTGDTEGVYGGTAAGVEIIVEKRSDVLTVPTRAVRSEDDTTYVTLVSGGKTARRTVELGETYGENTEILSGLESGDMVELVALPAGRRGGDLPEGGMPGGRSGDFPQLPEGGFPDGVTGGAPAGGLPGGAQ